MSEALDGFVADDFTYDGITHAVFRAGDGPAVVVLPEMPGITPNVAGFARKVAGIGCSVAVASLFGEPGRISPLYAARSVAGGCVSKEFTVLATRRTSPVAEWIRALARHEHDRCGGPGVGVVGMCFTGGFALAAAVEPAVLAPVLSQPSLPFAIGRSRRRELGLSDDDLAAVKRRVADDDLCALGLRFSADRVVPAERFARLREELGDGFVGVEIDSAPGNPHGLGRLSHSVLTEHLVDEPGHPTREALDQVLDLFRRRLLTP